MMMMMMLDQRHFYCSSSLSSSVKTSFNTQPKCRITVWGCNHETVHAVETHARKSDCTTENKSHPGHPICKSTTSLLSLTHAPLQRFGSWNCNDVSRFQHMQSNLFTCGVVELCWHRLCQQTVQTFWYFWQWRQLSQNDNQATGHPKHSKAVIKAV